MNSNIILNLLKPLILEQGKIDIKGIDDVGVRLEKAKPNQVVFYNLKGDKKSQELFKSRLGEKSNFLIILSQRPTAMVLEKNFLVIPQDKFLPAQKIICDHFFPLKRQSFKLIGITGTNGKSTTAYLGMFISTLLGHSALSVGTLGIDSFTDKVGDTDNTTPSYVDLRKILFTYQNDYKAFFLEVSSHSLDQNRLYDLRLDGGIFTSFSQDHLDYHSSMEEYFKSKEKMAKEYFDQKASLVIPKGEELLREKLLEAKVAKTLEERGIKNIPHIFKIPYNKRNLECALEINEIIWNDFKPVDIFKLKNPKGRFSSISYKDSFIVIDYAHTPQALERVLGSIKSIYPDFKVSVVFGCGGDRDTLKRPIMGKIASDFVTSGKIYLTSDNPRSEKPEKIIDDIKKGIDKHNFEVIPDRKMAIETAISNIKEKEILLIAGKGHEDYQEIKGVCHPFSDFKIVEEFLDGKKNSI
jgi:UDP-N-acetylmuramoyl-L-alanyl-D-glutamate--2,6-diaminopimelate ligase